MVPDHQEWLAAHRVSHLPVGHPMQALKYHEKTTVSVKHLIHSKLAGMEAARSHSPLRASSLLKKDYEFCPREHALLDLGQGFQKAEFVGTSLRHTFNHGRDTEKRIRNVYLRSDAVGQWKCRVCKFVRKEYGHCPDPNPCPKCGYKYHWEYIEPEFDHPKYGVQCHIDLLVKFPEKHKLHLTELKTMAPDEFKSLVAPLADHRQRTAFYLQAVAESGIELAQRIDTSEASIMYVSKAFGCKDTSLKDAGLKDMPFSPFKEFIIKRDDTLNATPLAKARVLKVWRDTKEGMPAGICSNGLTPRAQSCSSCKACYSGKYPATLTWLEKGKKRHSDKQLVE
jgi:hypothetical protein